MPPPSPPPRGAWGSTGAATPNNARTPRRPVAPPVSLRAVPLAQQHVRDTVLVRSRRPWSQTPPLVLYLPLSIMEHSGR